MEQGKCYCLKMKCPLKPPVFKRLGPSWKCYFERFVAFLEDGDHL